MVIACHYIAYGMPTPPSRFLILVGSWGGTGVDLFFVLSGFLITRILLAARGRPHFLKNFYMRRFLRIFPLYYGFLFFIYIAVPLLRLGPVTPLHFQVWFWTYTQNIGMTFVALPAQSLWQWTPQFWSLAVEEHFYMIWPFIVKYSDSRRLPAILLSTVPFAILCRCLLVWMGYGPSYLTPCRVDGLGLGSFLAVVAEHPEALAALRRKALPVVLLVASACAAGLYLFSGKKLPLAQILKDSVWAVAYAAVLLVVLGAKPGGRLYYAFSNRVLAAVGKYSYGMYVIHLTIMSLLADQLKMLWPPLALALLAAAVFAVAAVIWHVWERPFLNLKDRFVI
jgi:peptidoglycan/LPS O-acetylase OafA/YrhL